MNKEDLKEKINDSYQKALEEANEKLLEHSNYYDGIKEGLRVMRYKVLKIISQEGADE